MNIKDIARIAGVSVSTVSLVLNEKPGVRGETRLRVMSVMEKLNYVPNNIARSLVTKVSKSIGLIVADISELFFGTYARIIQNAVNREGYRLILYNSDNRPDKEGSSLDSLSENGVDGIIMVPCSEENAGKISRMGIPVVFLDSYVPGVDASYVGVHNEEAGRRATEHLIRLGHKRVACVTGPRGFSSSEERIRGYRKALDAHGITFNDLFLRHTDWTVDGGFDAANQLLCLKAVPTALFVTGDTCALGALKAVYGEGLRVPEDIAIVGFDDMMFSAFLKVPMTTVRQPMKALGEQAVKLLFEKIRSNNAASSRRVILQTRLIVRESCGFRTQGCGKRGRSAAVRTGAMKNLTFRGIGK
jgi:DNA-binding LacI/PurR family transcriptional regulator